ncbi:MAG TPA: BamA/TamA family outer membrane protein [Fibrobacteria bacterium]|nr:BamA/TamA family outer membrane protein [Fibrobacteria bacterium]HOX50205.1 BamA/TamA family outer membrane protein [Fibrobacteria bacterium]
MRIVAAVCLLAGLCAAQVRFGKNKVQYRTFDWQVVSTRHFDIHFASGSDSIAARAADSLEAFYARLVDRTGMHLEERVPFLLYGSHPQFQQTNVTDQILQEGIGGFTEAFRNRVVLPFEGSYRQFDHVLLHEMVHAVMFDALRQENGSRIGGLMRTSMPLWFSEGLAEYVSLDGWDRPSELWLMDAVTSGYLPMPTSDMQGFLAYRAGQNFLFYLDRTFGEGTVKKLVAQTLRDRDLERAFLRVTKVSLRDAGEEWIRELRWAYWPELGAREHGTGAGRKMTRAGEDGSFWNVQPALSPDGTRLAWFSDRGSRQGLYVGEVEKLPRNEPKRVLGGGGTPSHESFSPFRSGLSWSPDGKRIAVAAQSGGRNVVSILDARSGRVRRTLDPRLDALSNPEFSPKGDRIAFRGLKDGRADIWMCGTDGTGCRKLTDDEPDDDEPAFSPSGRWIAWSSEADSSGQTFASRSIWLMDLETGVRSRLPAGGGDQVRPSWGGSSDDSSRLAYQSDRSGLPQVYVVDRPLSAKATTRAVTNLLSGVQSPRISQDGRQVALSLFEGGAFDLYVVDASRTVPDSLMVPTRYVRTAARGRLDLFRPLVRENLESFRFDTLDHDSANQARTDSRRGNGADTGSGFPDTPADRLFGSRTRPALPTVPQAPRSSVDTAVFDKVVPPPPGTRPSPVPYRASWGVDHAAVAMGFSSYAGTAGQGMITLSDLMGDQTVDLMASLQGDIQNANVFARYGWLPWRTDLHLSVRHSRTFTGTYMVTDEDLVTDLYADRLWGVALSATRPFSMFHRLGADVEWGGIEREAQRFDSSGQLEYDPTRSASDRSLEWVRSEGEWVFDNVLWGPTGPWDGTRAAIEGSWMGDWPNSGYSYSRLRADLRTYVPVGKISGFAFRISAGESFATGSGENPHRFLLGGEDFTLNYHFNSHNIGPELDRIYFTETDVPLRGYRYAQFRGNKLLAGNVEFRFPFVEEIRFGVLLPPVRYLMGSLFLDAGGAWTSHSLVDQAGIGGGWGLRLNLGVFVLRWSQAWPFTEPAGVEGNRQPKNFDGSIQYWSLGGDF